MNFWYKLLSTGYCNQIVIIKICDTFSFDKSSDTWMVIFNEKLSLINISMTVWKVIHCVCEGICRIVAIDIFRNIPFISLTDIYPNQA